MYSIIVPHQSIRVRRVSHQACMELLLVKLSLAEAIKFLTESEFNITEAEPSLWQLTSSLTQRLRAAQHAHWDIFS